MKIKPKGEQPAPSPQDSARNQTWTHACGIMDSFRNMCHGDATLRTQAETKIRAKRVAEQWDARGKPAVDVFRLAGAVDAIVLDAEDQKQIDALYAAKIAFRDRLAASLGKLPTETWDAFHSRHAKSSRVLHVAKMFELTVRG